LQYNPWAAENFNHSDKNITNVLLWLVTAPTEQPKGKLLQKAKRVEIYKFGCATL